jgi:hypothetical protein
MVLGMSLVIFGIFGLNKKRIFQKSFIKNLLKLTLTQSLVHRKSKVVSDVEKNKIE